MHLCLWVNCRAFVLLTVFLSGTCGRGLDVQISSSSSGWQPLKLMTQALTSLSQPVNYLSCKHTWSRADAGLQPAPLKCIIDLKQMWGVYHRGPWKPGLSWLEMIQTVTFEVYCTHDIHVQQKQQTRALLHHLKVQPWMIMQIQSHLCSGETSPLILPPTSASSFAMWVSRPQNGAPSRIVPTRTNIARVNRSCCFAAARRSERSGHSCSSEGLTADDSHLSQAHPPHH